MFNSDTNLRTVCLALGLLLLGASGLAAQDRAESPTVGSSILQNVDVVQVPVRQVVARQTQAKRPSILLPLYVSFGALQAMDLHSTQRAIGAGGIEANPVMGTAIGSPLAMTAMKVGATTGIILLSEKLWKRNRVAAVVMMVVMNSGYATVAAHNYSIAR
jgi:hypothetical protein